MKNEQEIIQFEMVKPPFFKAGSLMFSSSSHNLVLSGRNYRCSSDCNGTCDRRERQIKKETMERNFCRYAQNFVMPASKETFQFADKLMRELFHGIIDGEDWDSVYKQDEYMDDVLTAMKADVKKSGTLMESDIDELQNTFTSVSAFDSRILLYCTLLGIFKSISEPENEVYLGRGLANICRRIHLSDKGKIQSILLERWGWYVLNYINRNFPEYFTILEKNKVKILNPKDDPILKLDLKEAVQKFSDDDNFEDALHGQTTKIFYDMFSMIKTLIIPIFQHEPIAKQKEAAIKGFEYLNSPLFQSMVRILQIGNARIRRKRNKKSDNDE
jgi:hypothetical protein